MAKCWIHFSDMPLWSTHVVLVSFACWSDLLLEHGEFNELEVEAGRFETSGEWFLDDDDNSLSADDLFTDDSISFVKKHPFVIFASKNPVVPVVDSWKEPFLFDINIWLFCLDVSETNPSILPFSVLTLFSDMSCSKFYKIKNFKEKYEKKLKLLKLYDNRKCVMNFAINGWLTSWLGPVISESCWGFVNFLLFLIPDITLIPLRSSKLSNDLPTDDLLSWKKKNSI